MDNFWNDELSKEFVKFWNRNHGVYDTMDDALAKFKASDYYKEKATPQKSERPPLGIKSKWLYIAERTQEINHAIDEYTLADKVSDIPEEYYEELRELDERLVELDKTLRAKKGQPQPPKEIQPKYIWAGLRRNSLMDAINEYNRLNRCSEIPEEWYGEIEEIERYLSKRAIDLTPPKEGNVVDQITAFKHNAFDEILKRNSDGNFGNYRNLIAKYYLESGWHIIYSARNSSGFEFSVGDETNYGKIGMFYIGAEGVLYAKQDLTMKEDFGAIPIDNLVMIDKVPETIKGNLVERITSFRKIGHPEIIWYGMNFHLSDFRIGEVDEIYSAKNKNGVEFVLGDETNFGVIESFTIVGDSITARFTNGSVGGWVGINDLAKKEKPEPEVVEDNFNFRSVVNGDFLTKEEFEREQKLSDKKHEVYPTFHLRWKMDVHGVLITDSQSSEYCVLEQLWKDTSGSEEWRPIEIVK